MNKRNHLNFRNFHSFARPIFILMLVLSVQMIYGRVIKANELTRLGLHVIPYPQEIKMGGSDFTFSDKLTVVIDRKASEDDKFAAGELVKDLKQEWNINASVTDQKGEKSIVLTRSGAPRQLDEEGYQLISGENEIVIRSNGEAGIFYGTQTLLQLIKKDRDNFVVPGMEITDWPDIGKRAAHYDTKHHQDKRSYVESFIKDLAKYKINQLIWEWEDKLEYTSRPEVGAP